MIFGVTFGLVAAVVWSAIATPAHVLLYVSVFVVLGVVYLGPVVIGLTRRAERRRA